ncbi:MAG TPA: PD-(D/E)XK nuclease family protein [Verrucomicrobiae bacterium]
MSRKSSAVEERARDLLAHFLQSIDRRPLDSLLRLIFQKNTPTEFRGIYDLEITSEVRCFGGSRADLVISSAKAILCIEVKVDAIEQVGQYIKYGDFFRSQRESVYVVGLVNRFKRANCRNDNEPFLQHLGIRRILWSELLAHFTREFGNILKFKQFVSSLKDLNSSIGTYIRPISQQRTIPQDCHALSENNSVLVSFYNDLQKRLLKWDGTLSKYGNAPYELHLGKASWASLFNELSCRRIVVGLNQPGVGKLHEQPYFSLCVMLWNRTWFVNNSWFELHRFNVAAHFKQLGYQVVRNGGSSWHRNQDWNSPYPIQGIKFANAFWERKFSLTESECCRIGWSKALDRLEKEIHKLESHVDSFEF